MFKVRYQSLGESDLEMATYPWTTNSHLKGYHQELKKTPVHPPKSTRNISLINSSPSSRSLTLSNSVEPGEKILPESNTKKSVPASEHILCNNEEGMSGISKTMTKPNPKSVKEYPHGRGENFG